MKCATCKYQKSNCQHIATITKLISEPDMPIVLEAFSSCLESCETRLHKKEEKSSVLSWRKISFDTPAGISHAFTQSLVERLQIQDGICYLHDKHRTFTCESCGQSMDEKEHVSRVITHNQILPAKGITFMHQCIVS